MEDHKKRLPIETSTLADELRKLKEATAMLHECYTLYARYYTHLSDLHRRGIEYMIVYLYQEIKDMELAPSIYQQLSMVCHELEKGLVWLYASIDTIEHRAVYAPGYLTELFATMRTEPEIPVVRTQPRKGGQRAK